MERLFAVARHHISDNIHFLLPGKKTRFLLLFLPTKFRAFFGRKKFGNSAQMKFDSGSESKLWINQ
jgi:hypothetical protein